MGDGLVDTFSALGNHIFTRWCVHVRSKRWDEHVRIRQKKIKVLKSLI